MSEASQVSLKGKNVWFSDSATSAASWLMLLAHWNMTDLDVGLPFDECFVRGESLCFRGQKAQYQSLIPTILRTNRTMASAECAIAWLRILVQIWTDQSFRYLVTQDPPSTFLFGYEDAEVVAQHCELPTSLLDWTIDPFVAFVFAAADLSPEEEGCVLVATLNLDSRSMMPPTSLERLWRQRGLLQKTFGSAELEQVANAFPWAQTLINDTRQYGEVTNYRQLRFRISGKESEILRRFYSDLMSDGASLKMLAEWAEGAADIGRPSESLSIGRRLDWLLDELAAWPMLPPLPSILQRATSHSENVKEQLDYLDLAALRHEGGQDLYDIETLIWFGRHLPLDSSLRHSWQRIGELVDRRAAVVGRVIKDPDRYESMLKYASNLQELAVSFRKHGLLIPS